METTTQSGKVKTFEEPKEPELGTFTSLDGLTYSSFEEMEEADRRFSDKTNMFNKKLEPEDLSNDVGDLKRKKELKKDGLKDEVGVPIAELPEKPQGI